MVIFNVHSYKSSSKALSPEAKITHNQIKKSKLIWLLPCTIVPFIVSIVILTIFYIIPNYIPREIKSAYEDFSDLFYDQENDPIGKKYLFVQKDGLWGVNKKNREIFAPQFKGVEYLQGPYFTAFTQDYYKNNLYHFTEGKVSDLVFEEIYYHAYENIYEFSKDGKTAYVNDLQRLISDSDQLSWEYKIRWMPSEGKTVVKHPVTEKYGYLDKKGKLIIPFQYDAALPFKDGLAKVISNKVSYFINHKNEVVVKGQRTYLKRMSSDYFMDVYKNPRKKRREYAIWNRSKEIVMSDTMAVCRKIKGDVAWVENDRDYYCDFGEEDYKAGLYDLKHRKFIIPIDSLLRINFINGYFRVSHEPSMQEALALVERMKEDGIKFEEQMIDTEIIRLKGKQKKLNVANLNPDLAAKLAQAYKLEIKKERTRHLLLMPNKISYFDEKGNQVAAPQNKPRVRKEKPQIETFIEESQELDFYGDLVTLKGYVDKRRKDWILHLPLFPAVFNKAGVFKNGIALAMIKDVEGDRRDIYYLLHEDGSKEILPYKLVVKNDNSLDNYYRIGDYTYVRHLGEYSLRSYLYDLRNKKLGPQIPYAPAGNHRMIYCFDSGSRRNQGNMHFTFDEEFQTVEEDPSMD